ncbi:hypothetical protein [Staphylococcus cohnii]|uniref:hypothetical protein n=1 Tax=Staphylococcus cohnii TaxID=29382 RepID=UPI000D1CB4CE|nr:hypothetical protein [Staphylococcus cohnii]PTE80569.1 hypothetical protein BUY38_02885 [Staphylococcus cohnii]PTF36541.1 hypothetical protein BUY25_02625 [Staphylococcus cohnii]
MKVVKFKIDKTYYVLYLSFIALSKTIPLFLAISAIFPFLGFLKRKLKLRKIKVSKAMITHHTLYIVLMIVLITLNYFSALFTNKNPQK